MCQVAPLDKIEHIHFLITKYVHDLGFPLLLLSVVAFVWTFLYMLKPPKQHKQKSLHDQRVEQWREYQKKQGHNIDEEYANSYGRRALWGNKK